MAPSWLHVTSGAVGSSTRFSRALGSAQLRASNSCWTCGVIHARSVGPVGARAPRLPGLALGARAGRRAGRRAGGRGRRGEGAVDRAVLGRGGARGRRHRRGRARGGRGARAGRRRGRGPGRRGSARGRDGHARPLGEHGTELHLGRLADRVADLLGRDLGDAHDDVLVTLRGDLGPGDAVGVDPLDDDVAGLVDLRGGGGLARGRLRLEDDLGAALEVEAQLRHGPAVTPDDRPGEQAAEGQDEHGEAEQRASRDAAGCGPPSQATSPARMPTARRS